MMKPIKKTRKITWQTMLSLTCLTAWMFSSPLVAQTNRLSIGEVTGVQGGILSLPVFLDNESEVAGGQFRLTLPDGMEVKGVEMETSRADKHTVEYYRSEKTHELSVVFYASPTAILKGNHGKICNVLLSIPINYATGDYPIGFGSGMKLASDAMTEAPVTEVISGIIHVESKPVVYYTIDITSTIGGHAEGGGTYAEGQDVVLTATAEDGYEFVKWSDGTYDNPYRLTVSRDMILQAEFSPKSYTLTYMLDGEIYHTEDVPYGSTIVPLEVPDKEGYVFSGWDNVPENMPAHPVYINGSMISTSIVGVRKPTSVDVYSIDGLLLKNKVPFQCWYSNLPHGLYIVNGKKIMTPHF